MKRETLLVYIFPENKKTPIENCSAAQLVDFIFKFPNLPALLSSDTQRQPE
jgi:hypothetical protein